MKTKVIVLAIATGFALPLSQVVHLLALDFLLKPNQSYLF